MANVEKTPVDNTSTIFKITLNKSDYLPQFEKTLKSYRNRAQLRGFRPGTAPMSVVKKMYGKAVLYETIMELINRELYKGIEESQLNILASPELVEDQTEKLELNVEQPVEQYTMSFKVGHYNLDLKGMDSSTVLHRYRLSDMSKRAEEELTNLARRQLRPEETTDKIAQGDIFYIEAKELDPDGTEKVNGHQTTITVYSKSMKMKPEAQALFFGKLAAGDEVVFNARDLEEYSESTAPEVAESNYRRFILNLETGDTREVNDLFKGVIRSVLRVPEPQLNEEFFENQFGPDVKTREQALEIVTRQLTSNYDEVFKSTLRREAKLELVAKNQIELPEAMLTKWFKSNDPRLTDSNLQQNLPKLFNQVRLQIITDYIADELGLREVSDAEVEKYFADIIQDQYGFAIPDQYLKPMIKRMMARKEEVKEAKFTLTHRKVMDYVVSQMSVTDISVTEEALKAAMDAQVERDQQMFAVQYS